jgi:predicted extracellular nuclease
MLNAPLNTIPVRVNRTRPPEGSDIRVVGLNLLNYFNGDGAGGGFPAPRGAKTPQEFSQQRGRLTAAIKHIQPHMVAVMELENDGFGPGSAARDFIQDLQNASGETWQVVVPQGVPVGGDVISVGIFYREDKLSAVGAAALNTGPEFKRRSRVPIAQKFTHKATGENFLVVVNHLKSKGSCPDGGANADKKDGQGCWNQARTQAATAMAAWAQSLADASTGGKVLILGDMNAYRMEDPITAILDAGFKNLKASSGLRLEFSYIYSGEAGTLDYAFASSQLKPNVRSAKILNINSIYARNLELPLPWLGSSDHDPVVVDLRFRQSSTSD